MCRMNISKGYLIHSTNMSNPIEEVATPQAIMDLCKDTNERLDNVLDKLADINEALKSMNKILSDADSTQLTKQI